MYVFADRDFITLGNLFDAEDNNRHILSYRSLLSDTAGGNNHLAGYASQTDENQIGPLSAAIARRMWVTPRVCVRVMNAMRDNQLIGPPSSASVPQTVRKYSTILGVL